MPVPATAGLRTGYIKRMDAFAERRGGNMAGQWWDGLDAATPGPVDLIADESPFPPIGEYGFLWNFDGSVFLPQRLPAPIPLKELASRKSKQPKRATTHAITQLKPLRLLGGG